MNGEMPTKEILFDPLLENILRKTKNQLKTLLCMRSLFLTNKKVLVIKLTRFRKMIGFLDLEFMLKIQTLKVGTSPTSLT